jgi:methylmalonyl-CoA carboxyltransferase small subunit
VKLKISIDNKTFEVDVEVAEPDHAALPPAYPVGSAVLASNMVPTLSAKPAADSPAPSDDKVCRSPVSGIVVRILVQVGQSLQTGDALMVLEAMKMETNLTAPLAGKVTAIRVAQGDNVQTGQVVVEFE